MKNNVTSKRAARAALLAAIGAGMNAEGRAQSAVELYGLVGTYVASAKRADAPTATWLEGSGGLTTSYWGMRGTEDLGGNLKAVFTLESFFQPDTGAQGRNATDPFFARNAFLGLQGGFGQFTFGRQTNPTYAVMQRLNPFGASVVFSPLVTQSFVAAFGGAIVGDTVWNNAVRYETPEFGGFSGTAIYGFGEVPGHNGTANIGLHGFYSGGNLTAGVSLQRVRTGITAPIISQDAYLAGFAYDFKWAKLFATIEGTSTKGNDALTRTYQVGFSVPVTKSGSVLVDWARTTRSQPRTPYSIRNTASLGYDYFLSKRTDVYAIYMFDKLSTASSGNTFALGLRHKF
ncbi:porin [Cupriavidus necator]|uniref:porin n=1 Tax=Cupriavidus necator TaxID=106590 RepID=UPI0039C0E81A